MSWGGHTSDMVNRIKENENLRKKRREKRSKMNELYTKQPTGSFKHDTDSMNVLMQQEISNKKKLRVLLIIVWSIVFIGIGIIIFSFIDA